MDKDMTFEEAISRLEDIVDSLETGSLSLDESLKKFEEGIRLSRLCNKKLLTAQQKVERLVNRDGKPAKEPMADK